MWPTSPTRAAGDPAAVRGGVVASEILLTVTGSPFCAALVLEILLLVFKNTHEVQSII